MSKIARSARGVTVDFELLAIKQQLANRPVPKAVAARRAVIEDKGDAPAPQLTVSDPGILELAQQAAVVSEKAAPQGK